MVKVNVNTCKWECFETTNEMTRSFWIFLGMLTGCDFAMNCTFDFPFDELLRVTTCVMVSCRNS